MKTTDKFFQEPDTLRKFVELSSEILVHLDAKQTVAHINQKGCELLGYQAEEIIGKNWFTHFIPCDIRDELAASYDQIMHGELEVTEFVESPVLTQSGEQRIILWHSATISDPEGNITGTLSTGEDITKRVEAEKQRDQSKESYKALFNAASDGVCITDIEQQRFIEVNPSLCNILGYSRKELLNKPILEIHPEEERENIIREFESHTKSEKFLSRNLPCLHKNGGLVYVDISSTITSFNGKEYIVGFFKDVTEQRHLEKKMQHSQNIDALGTLAGGIAHDFNNMLFIISGNINYALSHLEKNEDIYEPLSDALDGAKQAQKLTQQLLTFAKGGAPIKQATDINRIIQDSAAFISRGSQTKCLFDFAEDLWPAEVDEGQINQVISNLVMNALQAMPGGGQITIRTRNVDVDSRTHLDMLPGRYVKISIEDQGSGIPESCLKEIYEPFFTTKQAGNGLGLATTQSIVKKHGGHINVFSRVNFGTTFHVHLPAAPGIRCPETNGTPHTHRGEGRVLLMDDQQSVLNTSARILQGMGYETAEATDGVQAITMYKQQFEAGTPYDLVILDLTIPGGMSGLQTFSRLQAIDPDVKAIVSSGYSNDPIMANFRYYGFCGVAPKPYTEQQLAAILEQVFDYPANYVANDTQRSALNSQPLSSGKTRQT